jgi:hypothetical protein
LTQAEEYRTAAVVAVVDVAVQAADQEAQAEDHQDIQQVLE